MLNEDLLTGIVHRMLSELGRILETTKSDTNFIDGTTPETHSGGWYLSAGKRGFCFGFLFLFLFM